MKLKKETLDKIPFKETNYIFGLVFIYILILPKLFPLSNVMTAIFIGVYCYNTNKKGFSKSRALKRYVLYFLALSALLFICYFSTHNWIILLVSGFFITFLITFFGMEEYIPGLKDYFPTLYVFAIYQGNLPKLSLVFTKIEVMFVAIFIAAVYGIIMNKGKPIDRITGCIDKYIKTIIEEIEQYLAGNKQNYERAIENTREAYNECLKEYYKSSEGIYLVSLLSREIMRLMLKLHFLIENIRINPNSDKKKMTEMLYFFGLLLYENNNFNENDFVWNDKEETGFLHDVYDLKNKVYEKNEVRIRLKFFPVYRKDEFIYWFKSNFNRRSILFRYAMRLAILMTTSFVTAKLLKSPMGYWLPMTSVLLSQPYFEETYKRVVARVIGTFIGLFLASYLFKDINSQTLIYTLVLILNYIIFLIVGLNYFIAVIVITITAMLSTKGVQTQEVLFWNRGVMTFLAGLYSFLVSYIFKSTAQKEIKYNFTNLLKIRVEMLDIILNKHKGARDNRKFDRLMINSNMYREKIIFQLKKKPDKENIEFLGMDTIITERLIALHMSIDLKALNKDERESLALLRKVWLYTYTFINSGNITNPKAFLELNLNVRKMENKQNNDIYKLLSISYNYLLKVIKYSKEDPKQKRRLNFFRKVTGVPNFLFK